MSELICAIGKRKFTSGSGENEAGLVANVKWIVERTESGVRENCRHFWLDQRHG